MPAGASLWHSLLVRHARSLKAVLHRASQALDAQLSTGQPQHKLQTVLVRNTPKHPLHPLARIRQTQSRWYSSARDSLNGAVRHFSSGALPSSSRTAGRRFDRASLPKSRVGSYISQSSGRAPFASTLRPNLTGGTLGRTAGGYALGGSGRVGGARFFSHGPASQAQVVQNVSQGVRAFFLSGHKAQFNGTSPCTGEKRYRAVPTLQHETGRKLRELPRATPGSTLRYAINPTITALTPLGALAGISAFADGEDVAAADHLNTEGLLDALSVDFSRALKDLAAVLNDLKRLSSLGDLPITAKGSVLSVHFPGCDAETVERLCEEMNVLRGTVEQDESFDAFAGTEIALLFPFAPSESASAAESESDEDAESLFDCYDPHRQYENGRKKLRHRANEFDFGKQVINLDDMLTPSSPAFSTQSDSGLDEAEFEDVLHTNPWQYDGYSASSNEQGQEFSKYESVSLRSPSSYRRSSGGASSRSHGQRVVNDEVESPFEYQGFEGIYRFLEELESVRR